ncbi:hypothetical protein [Actinomyces ruminis]|uniref:DUF1772 domain-containing protein n=1 Tax=Actinomyces ruminis TaxID=1937003 RepID=A0ABX4MBF6_9ACTO|nr:hypothetical protein [Actinomyces ruminis]PHP52473.1 hypothetical protein BW737_009155 [Actinomyces ruminis]
MIAFLTLRVLVILTTAMVGGFLTMYCLTIGGYFSHMVRGGQIDELQRTYAPFRRRTGLKTTYAAAMLLQFFIAVAALAADWHQPLAGRCLAVAALPLLLAVHRLTGFTAPEEKLVSGQPVSAADAARYLRLNLPLHALYACWYVLAASWMLVEVIRG